MSLEDVGSSRTRSNEEKHKDEFYKDKLEELEKENQHLKLMKDSLQNHLNFLMKKIRHIKLAKSEDLTEEDSLDTGGIRFSITESNGLSSRCYTALFDSLEDLSINQGNDEFRISALDRLSSESSDSYQELNAYSPVEQPPQIHISRKRILSPIHDTSSFTHLSHLHEPILLPEDLKGSVLSPEIVIKSPRRSIRTNRSRTRVIDYISLSQPTSPDNVCKNADYGLFYTINLPDTPPSSQASPMDIIRSYHSAQDREHLTIKNVNDYSLNPWFQSLNPIAELIQYLPFYTCVRGVPRLAKVTASKVSTAKSIPSGSSSSFEIGESTLNPFNINPKISAISPLDLEDPPIESNYSELPSKTNILETECESNVSMEYCLPPEEGSTFSNNQSELRSPEQPHHSGIHAPRVTNVVIEKQILKRGILRKLNKKFKLWSNFFCILTNKGLFFYNIKYQPQPEDFFLIQKPVKGISVEIMYKIDFINDEKSTSEFYLGSFEVITKNEKNYTLATGDKNDSREWIRALRNVILQHQSNIIMQANINQILHRGWVTRVKWGYSKKLWCCLAGKYLIYFNHKNDYFPTGYRNLANCTVNTNTSVCRNSQNESNSIGSEISDSLDYPEVFFTISICQENSTPIFLCIDSEQELRTWSHYLKVSIQNISTEDMDPGKPINFNDLIRSEYHDHFHYFSGDIYQPISLNTSATLKTGAMQIWKALERLALVEHYSVRKENVKEKFDRISFLVQTCNQEPGLKDELYLQLMKQTVCSINRDCKTNHSKKSKFSFFCGGDTLISSTSSIHDNRIKSIREAEYNAILSMWECLAILIPIFLPSPCVLHTLRKYLFFSKDTSGEFETEISKYASYCLDQLNHVKELSGRLRPPSQFEVTAMSMRNPYTHSLPFSLPVYIHLESYQVISFSPLSSIQAIHESMLQSMFSPECISTLKEICLFAVYLFQPQSLIKYTFLSPESKICDVISKYEDYLNTKKLEQTNEGVIKFFFRIQAFKYTKFLEWYNKNPLHCLDVLKMLCYQIHSDVKIGHYSLSGSQLLILISYLFDAHRSESSEFWHTDKTMSQLVSDLFPTSLTKTQENIQSMKSLVMSKIKSQPPDTNITNIYFQYLRYVKEICDYQWSPTTIICVATQNSDCLPGQQLVVVCQETSISFLDYKCRICLKRIPITDILSFGSSSQHFLIAYSLLPMRKCFKRIILYLPDSCCSLELTNSVVFYLNKCKSQDF